MNRRLAIVMAPAVFWGAACIPAPLPTPAEQSVIADLDRSQQPPLYRKLYDYAFLPEVQYDQQKVRLRIWLHYMEFDTYQLGLLDELITFSAGEFAAVEKREREVTTGYEPEVQGVYRQIWDAMERDAPEAELAALAGTLDVDKRRETDLLEIRARSVRTVLDRQGDFLRTLTPAQDTKFADAVFALRHRLDPYANPGDFNSLVGTVYVAGEFGRLTQPTFDPAEDHLNIGGLWSPAPEKLAGPYFQDARRDVVLYMLLLEPALPEASAAAKSARARRGDARVDPALPGEGTPIQPVAPPPGVGAPPAAAGVPAAPTPAPSGQPVPAPPGAPVPASPAPPARGQPVPPQPGVPAPPAPPG